MSSDEYAEFIARKLTRSPATGLATVPPLLATMKPHQRDVTGWALRRGRAAIFADTGLGKAQPAAEPVLTPTGWRPIGDLRIGDHVIASDGSSSRVRGVFPQGVRDVFRVTFSDGAWTRCDGEHLWNVQTDLDASRNRPWRTMTTNQIVKHGLRHSESPDSRRRWRVPTAQSSCVSDADLPIDPYVLGVLLGDGSFVTEPSVTFCSVDDEIVQNVARLLPDGMRLVPVDRGVMAPVFRLSRPKTGKGRRNDIIVALRGFGLWGKYSHEKWVPPVYMTASTGQRLALLQGLCDTDGYASKSDGTIQFSTSSPSLARDVTALVRSLGGMVRSTTKRPTYKHNGDVRVGRDHYTLTLAMPDGMTPFRLSRKAVLCRDRVKYQPIRKMDRIDRDGTEECVCISIEHPSQLYVTRDYIVTHNTIMELEWSRVVAAHTGGDVLILAPLAVARQIEAEGVKFGIPVTRCQDQSDVRSGINVTNYDRLHLFDASKFIGVVLDESGCIKHHETKTLKMLLEAFASTPWKLCGSATPAPNDWTELGTHAEFLGVCSRTEMLAEFFCHDGGETQVWRLKGHARGAFWKFVSTWAAMVRKPSDLGHDDAEYDLPPLHVEEHIIPADAVTVRESGLLFAEEARSLMERRTARKASRDSRVTAAVEFIRAAWKEGNPSEPWLIWCDLNAEQDALEDAFGDLAFSVRGSNTTDEKEASVLAWLNGDRPVMISKSAILGWGLNFQHCARTVFVGVTDSWEAYYQAVRRFWRFGQKRAVHVHIFASEVEGAVVANLKRKELAALAMAEALSAETRDAVRAEVIGQKRVTNAHKPSRILNVPAWLSTETE